MSSVNKAIILGNLGADPELKYTPSRKAVCELRIATSEKWKDGQGQQQERTEWHSVVVWGKTAENCKQYLAKGRQVFVEGRIQTRSWDDKTTGDKRYKTEIVADRVTFIGGGKGEGAPAGQQRGASGPGDDFAPPPGDDSEIPF